VNTVNTRTADQVGVSADEIDGAKKPVYLRLLI